MMTMTQSIHSNIITLHDAITDTLVYRAATLHFDKQLDAFTCWINDLAQQTKTYAEKLKQLNAETISLTNKLNPTTMVNDYLLDAKITGMAATNYGDALKINLSFKLKTVSDLEGNFTQPIQHFANQHIRDFKDFRDRHERALKKYEEALAKYASFNGDDDSTTTQLDEARKTYVEMSSEHVLRIIKLRHELEHFLIQQFSTSTASRKEFFDDAQVWNQIDTILFSWTKWLAEDKRTSRSEVQKQQQAQQTLEKEYLERVQRKFSDTQKINTQSTTYSKSGYLWVKPADDTASASADWHRQWFFVHDGYFGSCKVTNPKKNASITVDNCVPLRTCHSKPVDISNRRFCFEVSSGQQQQPYKSLFVLQAENQQDLTDWMAAFTSKTTPLSISANPDNKHSRPSSIIIGSYDSSNDPSRPRSPALLLSKSKSTTVVTTPVTLSTISATAASFTSSSSNANISNIMSTSPSGSTIHSILSRPHSITAAASHVKVTCSTSSSSTPLLLREMTNGLSSTMETQLDESLDNSSNDKRWGTPRYVFSHGNQQHTKKSTTDNDNTAPESILPPDADTPNYLHDKTRELRSLFYGVSDEDVVVEVFMASYLKRKPLPTILSDQQNSNKSSLMSMNSGYYYGGCVYVTQDTLWFYSKISFNCITSVVLKLKDIEEIHVNHRTTKMTIDIVDSNDPATSSLVFSLIHDDVTAVAKKLHFLVYNAKLDSPMSLDTIHQRIIAMSTPTPSLSSTISSTERSSLNESPCSSFLTSHSKDPPPGLSSRVASSTTTATMDTVDTLVTPISEIMTKKIPTTTNNKAASKRFIDPDAIPDHINKPSEPVSCHCEEHLDNCEAQVELPISAKRLYELMFSDETTGPSTDGGVWNSKTKGIYARDLRISRWEWMDSEDQQPATMKRVLKYWMPVANPIVRIKEAEVVETQTLLKKDDYLCYVVQISTKTESLPFADAFVPSVRYCITYVNDSRCQLTCCMGIKWLKWIMAKMIVTRAALSGMSESINVFIPILTEEANTIQLSVDNIRQSELHLAGIPSSDDGATDTKNDMPAINTNVNATSRLSIDTAHKHTTATNEPTNRNRQLSNARPLPQSQQPTAHTKSSICTNHTDTLLTPITERMTATTLTLSSTLKWKTTQLHRWIKASVLNASCHNTPPMLIEKATGILQPFDLWKLIGVIMIGYLFYAAMVCLLTFSGARLDQLRCSPVAPNQVVAHAVYLRDLDKGFIKNSLQPPYGESESYKFFLESRREGQSHTWYDGRYYRLAQEYDTNREQLGILRQGVINMFQAVNTADTYLLENEYLNWLLDSRQRCRHQRKLIQQQTLEYNDISSHLCDQINSQIGTYF